MLAKPKNRKRKPPVSIRISDEARWLVCKIAEKKGISIGSVWEEAIREKAEREGIK